MYAAPSKIAIQTLIDQQPTTISPSLIPPGWTTDPEELAYYTETFDDLAQTEDYDTPIYGEPRAILANETSRSPEVLVEVSDPNDQHDHKYYIYNDLSEDVFEVITPKTAKDIVPLLVHLGNPEQGPILRKLEFTEAPVDTGKSNKPTFVVPPGWTADPQKMSDLSDTFIKLRRMKTYDTPISGIPRALLADNKSGVPNVLVEVSDPYSPHDRQYYIWNKLNNFVSEVLAPKTAKEIAPLLLADGEAEEGLVVRKLKTGGAPVNTAKSDKPTFFAPLGWTADPEEMADLDKAFEVLIRKEYDIPKSWISRTLLASEGGVPDVLVELSDPDGQHEYYIWNQLSADMSKVVAPTTAEKIIPLLASGKEGKGELVTRLLE